MKKFLLIIFIILSLPLLAQTYTYRGTLGNENFSLFITESTPHEDPEVDVVSKGYYIYKEKRREVTGYYADSARLYLTAPYGNFLLSIVSTSPFKLSGTYSSTDSHVYKVNLTLQ